jgi:NADPH:quinone reductase-like Zn-dependent oxidoreductase
MATQKAYRLHAYGGPECIHLDTVPVPTPLASQALIAVSVVGINPLDWKLRSGYIPNFNGLQLPITMGVDFTGTVVALGTSASRLKLGDRVMGMSTSLGAFAEHVAVDESILARVPAALSDTAAATLPIPARSAWVALHSAGELKPGMRILVHGASGTVGAFAVQFAKAEGCHVVATASGKNKEYVMDLGADEFVDYKTEKFEDIVKDIDLVLDFVLVGGADNTTDRSWDVLKPGGAIVSVADMNVGKKVPDGKRGIFPDVRPDTANLEMIAEQLANGKIMSKIAEVFPREKLGHAIELNKAGGSTGRLLVDFKRV